ncbi:MAG: hypothetical protein KGL25_12415, partial [Gammaproteobacteria bacterium]|nr:hypothetical protein [Gammaproteobacteria bacterium]
GAKRERADRAERAEPSFEAAAAAAAGNVREPRRSLPVIAWPESGPAPPVPTTEAAMDESKAGGAVGVASPAALAQAAPPPMVIDWPEEHARRIVTLRIVPAGNDRLAGRAVRQGLSACGFRHGEFGIFHLPGEDGRVILSAASLVRPGTLDPASMDFQRFAGLNLFAVLPGPLDAGQALERLGHAALDLASRVSGRVQDDLSTSLGAAGVADWRRRMMGTLGTAGPVA